MAPQEGFERAAKTLAPQTDVIICLPGRGSRFSIIPGTPVGALMIPFAILIIGFFVFRAIGLFFVPAFDSWQPALRAALVPMFLVTASAHWGKRRPDLIRMVPPIFPRPDVLVTLTGVAEIIGALGLLLPATASAASIGLALLLGGLFPANVYAARRGLTIRGRPATPLLLRTALQVVFIGAVLAAGW